MGGDKLKAESEKWKAGSFRLVTSRFQLGLVFVDSP